MISPKIQGFIRLGCCFLAVLAAVLLLLPEERIALISDFLGDYRDAMHAPLFAVVTLLFLGIFGWSRMHAGRGWLWISGLVTMLAVGSELLQQLSDRSPSGFDTLADVVGICFATVFSRMIFQRRWISAAICFIGLVIGTLFLASQVMAQPVIAKHYAKRLPVVFDGGWWAGSQLLRAKSDTGVVCIDGRVGISAAAGDWRGVEIVNPHWQDWERWNGIFFDVENPNEAFDLGVRLDTLNGDRLSGKVQVPHGRTTIGLPFDQLQGVPREVDSLSLHFGAKSPARRLVIYSVWLK